MDRNATDEETCQPKVERGDNPQHARYIICTGQDADDNQNSILQPVSGSQGRKMKGKAETHHGAEWDVNKPDGTQVDCAKRSGWEIAIGRVESRSSKQFDNRDLLDPQGAQWCDGSPTRGDGKSTWPIPIWDWDAGGKDPRTIKGKGRIGTRADTTWE